MESTLALTQPKPKLSAFEHLKSFVLANTQAWLNLDRSPNWLLPTVTVICLSVALTIAYYSSVDMEWLRSEIAASYPALPADGFNWMNRRAMVTSGIASFVLIYPMVLWANAIYLFLYARVLGDSREVSKWFAFASWCALPSALSMLAGLLLVLVGGPRQTFESIFNALSIVGLIEIKELPQSAALLAGLFSAPLLLQLAATTNGLRLWLKTSWWHALIISCIPIALMYLWMLFS